MSSQPFFQPAASSPGAAREQRYIQPTLNHGLRIWWAFFWRNTLVSLGLGALLGLTVGYAARSAGIVLDPRLFTYGGAALEYFTAIFVMHYIVQKKFRGFRIILTSSEAGDSAPVLPPIFRRTFRIWWTYTWRSVIYRIVLTVAMTIPLGFLTGAMAAISPQVGQAFGSLMGIAISGAVGLFTIYSNILDEDIAGFRVSLAPRSTAVWPEEHAQIEPATPSAGPAVL